MRQSGRETSRSDNSEDLDQIIQINSNKKKENNEGLWTGVMSVAKNQIQRSQKFQLSESLQNEHDYWEEREGQELFDIFIYFDPLKFKNGRTVLLLENNKYSKEELRDFAIRAIRIRKLLVEKAISQNEIS